MTPLTTYKVNLEERRQTADVRRGQTRRSTSTSPLALTSRGRCIRSEVNVIMCFLYGLGQKGEGLTQKIAINATPSQVSTYSERESADEGHAGDEARENVQRKARRRREGRGGGEGGGVGRSPRITSVGMRSCAQPRGGGGFNQNYLHVCTARGRGEEEERKRSCDTLVIYYGVKPPSDPKASLGN